MNIASILHDEATRRAGTTAIVHRGRTIAFDDLDRAVSAAARDLRAAGLGPGKRVLVLVPMSIELYVVLIALFRLRATAVIVDPSAGRARLDQSVTRVAPDALVAVPKAHLLRLFSRAVRRIPLRIAIGGYVPFARRIRVCTTGVPDTVEPCPPDTPAIITFTSGSTGEPKAAVRTHGFLLAQHRALAASLSLIAGEVDLTTLPIFLLANLASGVTSVVPDADLRAPGAIDPGPVLAQVRETGATRTVASPAFLLRLAGHSSASAGLAGMERIFTGGAPVFPRALDALAAAAPGAEIVAVYGSTEAEPIAEIERRQISEDDRRAMREGAGLIAGVPDPAVNLAILNDRWSTPLGPWTEDDFAREVLPPLAVFRGTAGTTSTGEIVVSGEHVLAGYLDGRGDPETKIRVGERVWHRTGDAGYLDRSGRLWLLGRCAAKVDDEHGRVYPFAVECAASDVEGLRRSAFVRRDGARTLVVEPAGGADTATVIERVRERLTWARLADVLVVARIPVDARHNAKVDYPALEKLLAARR
jgi:olefin beta-lactone synthetase